MLISEIADVMIQELNADQKLKIAGMNREDLSTLHRGLGTLIRNRYVWGHLDNFKGFKHHDDVSDAVIAEIWEILQHNTE